MWSIGLRSPLGVFDTDVTFNLLMTVHFNFYDMIQVWKKGFEIIVYCSFRFFGFFSLL